MIFSYGSGMASSVYSVTVLVEGTGRDSSIFAGPCAALDVLPKRWEISPEEFTKRMNGRGQGIDATKATAPEGCLFSASPGSIDELWPQTYYLASIDKKWRRSYALKE